jgi:hypothetical protein
MKVKTNIRGGLRLVTPIDYIPPPSLGGGCRGYP